MTSGKQKLERPFPGELERPLEKRDIYEGELGHATISLLTVPSFGESVSTIILRYQQMRHDVTISLLEYS